ncbi:hypothetical protein Sango_1248100 [Sesamum angolense]|uniref:Uncharacterized protein n=1 Tax=Sesamum angolense TaxID=2727404 RepID=A0AAE1WQR4_9LAMI|nr:hypothetical protein Sango_1248100 [Sesamum angolense]
MPRRPKEKGEEKRGRKTRTKVLLKSQRQTAMIKAIVAKGEYGEHPPSRPHNPDTYGCGRQGLVVQAQVEEWRGPRTQGNDALVITTLLANYDIERVFIDSGSSADILFGEAYDQMQLGYAPLEAVDTSLYSFAGEVVHPRCMISLPLTLGTAPL